MGNESQQGSAISRRTWMVVIVGIIFDSLFRINGPEKHLRSLGKLWEKEDSQVPTAQ